jgi:hypothetical protein
MPAIGAAHWDRGRGEDGGDLDELEDHGEERKAVVPPVPAAPHPEPDARRADRDPGADAVRDWSRAGRSARAKRGREGVRTLELDERVEHRVVVKSRQAGGV